ncbi:hypothetical protein PO883_13125 [Massilia sp. DJPM01]|uniref:hypothetical protein n=1 Tax=Massilia sp. DJPM01 TaxID=3024404 RepID=UPI00259E7339|nr:hypothetical protein [Massilia sp. DJPM01]MDM5178134.1 hypothetical protein [Massilia sp. DJPM01]
MIQPCERGNMALRSLIRHADAMTGPDVWDSGYFRGQISTIEGYLQPDPELLQRAKASIDLLAARAARTFPSAQQR